MTTFVVYCGTAGLSVQPTNPSFGRFDIIARCVNSALWLSNGLRDSDIHFFLERAGKTLSFSSRIRKVSPDERSMLMWIEKVFSGIKNPGIELNACDFPGLLERFEGRKIYLLDMGGKNFFEEKPEADSVFILADNLGLPEEVKAGLPYQRLSIGPKEYLASHVISFVSIAMDSLSNKTELVYK